MRTHGILWFSLLSFGCGHSDSAPNPVITVKIDASVAARAPATIDAGPHSGRDAGDAGEDAAASTSNDMPSQSCCVNGFYYACPSHEAFEKCSGFDMSKCYASCDPSDTACTRACSQQSINTPRDPSGCKHDQTRDGLCPDAGVTSSHSSSQTSSNDNGSGSSSSLVPPPTNACGGAFPGLDCDVGGQCPAGGHCTQGKCFPFDVGNPCTYATDCGSGNHCTRGCCFSGAKGSPCDAFWDCTSQSCTNSTCQ